MLPAKSVGVINRIWDQVIGVFPPYLSLTLIHPDGRGHTHWTDLCHLEEVQTRNWYEVIDGYAATGGTKERRMCLHWLPLGKPPEGMKIDHIDKNTFNSCRNNLRIVPNRVNMHNASNHGEWGPCITHNSRDKNWQIQMNMGGKPIYKPCFTDPDKAIKCRDEFLLLANAYDRGDISLPSYQELVNIAHKIRGE